MGYLDANGLTRVWEKIKTLFDTKVDKVDGMGLSQENYTTDEKDSLSSIQNSMSFLVTFGSLSTQDGRIVIGADEAMNIFNATIVSEETIDDKESDLINMIQNAVSAANLYTDNSSNDTLTDAKAYTDNVFDNIATATTESNGYMSATDKARLDEIWAAWSTKNFLAVAKNE